MHVVVSEREVTPSVVPNSLQASVCDEQLMSIGGEIALPRNSSFLQIFHVHQDKHDVFDKDSYEHMFIHGVSRVVRNFRKIGPFIC